MTAAPSEKIPIVFMGTSAFAVPTLARLFDAGFQIVGVVTQPDKPSGRGQAVHDSPVKRKARELQLSIHQPQSLKDPAATALFEALSPRLIVVVAYGKILPPWLIHLPEYGALNLHGSLLPKYRGAAPIHWAIANGETETGVTTMLIDEGLDTGPMFLSARTNIGPDETVLELSERLAAIGADLMVQTIQAILARSIEPAAQDSSLATYAPILKKSLGFLDWRMPAESLHNRVRAFNPWPGALTAFRNGKCKILKTRLTNTASEDAPGVLRADKRALFVNCGDGRLLEVLELQPENRKPVSAPDFVNGARVRTGEKFEPIIDNKDD